MFSELLSNEQLHEILLTKSSYHPFPTVEERNKWEHLPVAIKNSMIIEGEKYLDYNWPSLSAKMYMEFYRNGNRTRYDGPYHLKRRALTSLVLAECMENKGRFIDEIINGIFYICEESTWVISAHNHMFAKGNTQNVSAHEHGLKPLSGLLPDVENPGIDLFAAETSNALSWTFYLLKSSLDKVSPAICRRIELEVKRRILEPYLQRDDMWWMGLDSNRSVNNWTTWCTSNCLSSFLLLEDDMDKRVKAIERAFIGLDRFMETYNDDGGCDEGPGYWNKAGGSLFDCLELLYTATDGKINLYNEPKIKNIGRYINKVNINKTYFVNFSDNSHRIIIEGSLVYRFGERIGDENLKAIGWSFHNMLKAEETKNMKFFSLLRVLPAIFNYEKIENENLKVTYDKNAWLDGIQVMIARESTNPDEGLYVAMKGGHNAESHNHNDVGHFVVYADGEPVLIDPGVETYSARTFSSERYSIWTMMSSYHNLPDINGMPQIPGRDAKASVIDYYEDANTSRLCLDLTKAYPSESGIQSLKRTCELISSPSSSIAISDEYSFRSDALGNDLQFNYITLRHPDLSTSGIVRLPYDENKALCLCYDPEKLSASSEIIKITDTKLVGQWGDVLYRILLKPLNQSPKGIYKVLIKKETL